MLKQSFWAVVAVALTMSVMSSKVNAYGAAHVGYTHVGPNGAYHVGATEVSRPGGVGYHYGATGAYGGYHYGATGADGGYHYGATGAYGGYHYSQGYSGAAVGGYRYGYVR